MRPRTLALVFLFGLLAASLFGASSSVAQELARCDNCHMRVRPDSSWRAGGRGPDGARLHFDSPKCFFRFHFDHGPVTHGWMIDRRTRTQRPAGALHFLLGADLRGPMGSDLVPVEGLDHARELSAEHHARRVLAFDEVTRDIVLPLFGGHRHH